MDQEEKGEARLETEQPSSCCCCQTQFCRRECSLYSLGLKHPQPQLFYTAQWRWPPLVYVTYRALVAIYFFIWIIHSGTGNIRYVTSEAGRVKWFIFLTNWTNFMLTSCVMMQGVIAIVCYLRFTRRNNDLPAMTWYLKWEWVWYNISSNSAFLLTALYWGLLYANNPVSIEEINFHVHAFNSIYMIIDLFITAMPLRLLHFFHAMTYALIYIIFSAIYTVSGGTNGRGNPYIYSVLDWNATPSTAVVYAILSAFVGMPVIWLIVYGVYRLRLLLVDRCCQSACCQKNDVTGQDNYALS